MSLPLLLLLFSLFFVRFRPRPIHPQVIGKVVQFSVNYVGNAGREYAQVKLDDKNLAEVMVSAGYAKVVAGTAKKDGKLHPYVQPTILGGSIACVSLPLSLSLSA